MKKKEKLEEFNWVSGRDAITIALCNTIIKKQNEIIDYLNTQPQTEEYEKRVRIKGELSGGKRTLTTEQIRGEFDKERVKEWDRTAVETYKQATQDTPEEWEKRFVRTFGYWGEEIKFIKQLLKERELEVWKEASSKLKDNK